MPRKLKQPRCLQCKGPRSGSFAAVVGGAMIIDRRTQSSAGPGAGNSHEAFWHLVWHGAHGSQEGTYRDIYEHLVIIDDQPGGEFELQFCTTRCLRRFLNAKVDELEDKREKEERLKKKRKKKTSR